MRDHIVPCLYFLFNYVVKENEISNYIGLKGYVVKNTFSLSLRISWVNVSTYSFLFTFMTYFTQYVRRIKMGIKISLIGVYFTARSFFFLCDKGKSGKNHFHVCNREKIITILSFMEHFRSNLPDKVVEWNKLPSGRMYSKNALDLWNSGRKCGKLIHHMVRRDEV